MTLTVIRTKATAASLRKYILYSTCHSFSVCNFMFAIKNSCAEHVIYEINAFKSSVSFCDRLVSPGGICHFKPQSAIPTLFSLPITRFISNCWLITKSYGLWERPQNGSLMFLWFSIGIAAFLVFFLFLFFYNCLSIYSAWNWGQMWDSSNLGQLFFLLSESILSTQAMSSCKMYIYQKYIKLKQIHSHLVVAVV